MSRIVKDVGKALLVELARQDGQWDIAPSVHDNLKVDYLDQGEVDFEQLAIAAMKAIGPHLEALKKNVPEDHCAQPWDFSDEGYDSAIEDILEMIGTVSAGEAGKREG
jgi:hypothetical protein